MRFFSPSENWCLPATSTIKPEERELVVDSSASMNMISNKDLNSAEMDALTTPRSPTTVIKANREVQTHEEASIHVRELDIFLTMKVLENTPAVLSLGMLCDEHGYSYEWINGLKPHLTKKVFEFSVIRKTSYQSWFLVYHRTLPQARLLRHLQKTLIIQITLQQSCQAKVWIDKYEETRILLKHHKICWINQQKSQTKWIW